MIELFERWQVWMGLRGSFKAIMRDGEAYLDRYYLLAVRGFCTFLHTFWMDDPDPLHDHPWPWGRVILRGRYREHYHDGTFADCGPGHVVWRRQARVLHRVELLTESVTTLFWHWRRERTWGFVHSDGWRPTPDEGQDGRPIQGWLFPRKVGPPPEEVVHE